MKVCAVFKWARDPNDARVGLDGSIDWRGVKLTANDDDPAVMDIARALAGGDDITAITVGDGDVAWAATRGAARTVVVEDALPDLGGATIAAALVAAIHHSGAADVVLVSDSVWDLSVVAAVTGGLGWPALAGVIAAEAVTDGLLVTRRAGSGSEVVALPTPAVLAVAATHAEAGAPGMKDVLAARKKPVEKLTLAGLGVMPAMAAATRATRLPDVAGARLIDGTDPAAAAAELLAALRSDGTV